MPGWAAGAYNGPVGEAYFLEDLYQVTRKQEYRDFVLRTADVLMEAASRDDAGCSGASRKTSLQMADLLFSGYCISSHWNPEISGFCQ